MFWRALLRWGCLGLVWCLTGGLLIACAGPGTSQGSVADVGIAPVTLRDPSPDQLTFTLFITLGNYDAALHDTSTLDLQFTSHNHPVLFTGNEQFSCNGQAIDLHKPTAERQISQKTSKLAGQTFRCIYHVGQTFTMLNFTVPQAPRILSPQEQTRLPRGKQILITYDPQNSLVLGIVALTTQSKTIAQLDTPVPHQATLDSSAFPPGPGTLTLTATLHISLSQTGTPFAQITSQGEAHVQSTINWT